MKTPSILPLLVLLVALAACRSHPGPRLGLAMESPGPLSLVGGEVGPGTGALARPGAEELKGTQEVRAQAW
ncbi:MAG TPA: hypothetical protein VK458_17540, partial [Myxococcaceae bacterium]|nr:hypothetical protein [Myxococcaceae bacterium]